MMTRAGSEVEGRCERAYLRSVATAKRSLFAQRNRLDGSVRSFVIPSDVN
jgi:hypothetical protein